MAETNLPFNVGQMVEVKAYEDGYRGAWFKCKILKIFKKAGKLHYSLEYVNFPEEATHETQVFQRFQDGEKEGIMVRPPYPPYYHESKKLKGDQEPLHVIHRSWKVGDSIDWWKDDCYWSGKVLKMVGKEVLQIALIPKPRGEGGNYKALCKDLRPSLEWSLEDGWKLPSMDGQRRQCTRLVKRENEDQVSVDVCNTGIEQKNQKIERETQPLISNSGDLRLNIMESYSIEAAVYDLEELIVRVQWIKGMLALDVEGSKSSWKYEDHRPSYT